ncbi:hypothetical protein [Blautia producta]|uniref:Uncharacterized protein n=2 Tax=Blautia producta TaxID=33035 RepID=A0A7G5N1E2_9FIRM|nr:hypothetical protein [Blautia producta]QIB56544.1 hypothetical protein GXM18_17775 [Blautia producta ATCC 27340 = DSM 2950]QMW80685.1 hypothetical protein E5259_25615 [Blautia producta]
MERKNGDKTPRDSAGREVQVTANPICESSNRYVSNRGDKSPKEITNFVMRPVNGIRSDSAYLMDIEFTVDKKVFISQLDSSVFAGAQMFKKAIKKIGGIDMVFSGTEDDLANIQKFMTNKYREYNHCLGLDYVGLFKMDGEWVYVGTDGAIDRKGNPIRSVISITEDNEALRSGILDTPMIKKSELKEISVDLFRFNTYERTINILGWVGACFLKERLRQRKIKLSHLVIAGGAGSGKSETLEKIIQPIFGLQGSGIGCSGITKFSTLKSTSSTNLLPVIFEEYKPHKLSKIELDLISGTLRSTYDYQTSQRGRADQSVVNYMRRSPICLVGESSFDETAIKERTVDVQFAKSDRTAENTKSYRYLAKHEDQLNSLGKALLLLVMNMSDEALDELIQQSKVFEKLDFETRTILGMSNVYLGILLMKELYESFGLNFWAETGLSEKMVQDSIVNNTYNSLDGSSKVNSAVDLIIQTFDTMALKNRIRPEYDYTVNQSTGELCLRLNLIYDEFTKYIREFNISDVEVLGIRQFTRQLRREGYYADYNYRNFKERNNDEIVRQKCYILDLKKLNANLNLEAFAYEMTGITTDADGFMAVDEQCELPFT